MNNADILDHHLAQMAASGLTAAQYLALHPQIGAEARTMLLLTQQLHSVAHPIAPLSDDACQRIFMRIQHTPPGGPTPLGAEAKSPVFFIPGFNRLEAIRYVGAHGLEMLWRIHKAPSGCAVAIFDAVVLLMRALRRLEMYNSFR